MESLRYLSGLGVMTIFDVAGIIRHQKHPCAADRGFGITRLLSVIDLHRISNACLSTWSIHTYRI